MSNSMEDYDNLPPEMRRILQESPINVGMGIIPLNSLNQLAQDIDLLRKTDTLRAYGPTHPSLIK